VRKGFRVQRRVHFTHAAQLAATGGLKHEPVRPSAHRSGVLAPEPVDRHAESSRGHRCRGDRGRGGVVQPHSRQIRHGAGAGSARSMPASSPRSALTSRRSRFPSASRAPRSWSHPTASSRRWPTCSTKIFSRPTPRPVLTR
jgi:hypothetical protein